MEPVIAKILKIGRTVQTHVGLNQEGNSLMIPYITLHDDTISCVIDGLMMVDEEINEEVRTS